MYYFKRKALDQVGLLPEGLRLKSIQSGLKTSQDDLFSLFAATGAHAIGDVYALSKSLKQITHEAPKLKQIDFYQYFFKLNQINSYAIGEDAIAGVQEKISASVQAKKSGFCSETLIIL